MINSSNYSQMDSEEINQIFDDITFSESKIAEKAFAEGLLKGTQDGDVKGYRLGFLKGVEFGAEIGYYEGITKTLLELHGEDSSYLTTKSVAVLAKLCAALKCFPQNNCPNTDIINQREQVRSYYKQLCSLLKLDFALIGEELSF